MLKDYLGSVQRMRLLPLLAFALLLMAGCSSKPSAPAAAAPQPAGGGDGGAPQPGNDTLYLLQFAGGYREAELPVAVTFAQTDTCLFLGRSVCPEKSVDLTPIVPPGVPVELSVTLAVNSNFNAYITGDDAVSIVQYSSDYGSGTISIDVLLIRGGEGAVALTVQPVFPSADGAAAGPSATGTAHSVVRASVVPAYVPVAVELNPGETVNATGDGLEQLVAYPPGGGPPVRDLTAPFGFQVPASGPAGTYILFATADEAVRLMGPGPNRTLSAHRLVYLQTDPVDLVSGQEATWDMAIPGLPVEAGVVLESKDTVPDCCSAGSFVGSRAVSLTAPGNVQVIMDHYDCMLVVACSMTLLGNTSEWYGAPFLDEHLVPGTYTASVKADQTNASQAFSWALYIQ